MKDWRIQKLMITTEKTKLVHKSSRLVHIHSSKSSAPAIELEDGKWHCIECDATAPEEMVFVALLAGCWGSFSEHALRNLPDK